MKFAMYIINMMYIKLRDNLLHSYNYCSYVVDFRPEKLDTTQTDGSNTSSPWQLSRLSPPAVKLISQRDISTTKYPDSIIEPLDRLSTLQLSILFQYRSINIGRDYG